MISARPYQNECINAIRSDYQAGHKRLLVVLPTASGKTITFSRVLKARRGAGPSLVIAHTEELLSQAGNKIHNVWSDATIGLIKAEVNKWQGYDIVVASIQSISKSNRLAQIPQGYFKTIVVDEAHHAAAASYINTLNSLANDNTLVIGWTATPNRGDRTSLRKAFEKISFFRSIDQMVDEGWLVSAVSQYVNIQADFSKVKTIAGDFNLGDLSIVINTEENCKAIVRAWWKLAWKQGRKKTIVFSVDVKHAEDLNTWFLKAGVRSAIIHGGSQNRQEIIQDLRDGKLDVLCNCQILTEGFDDDEIDCIVMARPTQSQVLYVQMAGRGLRPILGTNGRADFTQKADCLILDAVGNAVNHKLVTLPVIYGKDGYKPNTTASKDVAKQSAPRKVRLIGYGDSRQLQSGGYSLFSWLEISDEEWCIQFPFKHSYFIRIWFNFNSNTWEYQQVWGQQQPVVHVINTYPSRDKAIIQAEADIIGVVKDPSKMARNAFWRKHKISKKQIDLLNVLKIKVDDVYKLTIGEASDIIGMFFVGRTLNKIKSLGGDMN